MKTCVLSYRLFLLTHLTLRCGVNMDSLRDFNSCFNSLTSDSMDEILAFYFLLKNSERSIASVKFYTLRLNTIAFDAFSSDDSNLSLSIAISFSTAAHLAYSITS